MDVVPQYEVQSIDYDMSKKMEDEHLRLQRQVKGS